MEVPRELAERDQWVIWRYETRRDKTTKAPYRASDGKRASSTKASDWSSFQEAIDGLSQHEADGVGFVFSEEDPFCGIDLDQCFQTNGEVHPEALRLIEELGSYTELSPSGKGVHIIARAALGDKGRRTSHTEWGGNLEAYDRGRYFTFTGQPFDGYTRIRDSAVRIEVFDSSQNGSSPGNSLVSEDWKSNVSDVELFEDLARGDWESHDYGSQSQADMAYVNMLVHAMGPMDQFAIFEQFKISGLYRGEAKSGGDGYVIRTIREAISKAVSDQDSEKALSRAVAKELRRLEVRDQAKDAYLEKKGDHVQAPEMRCLKDELDLPDLEEVHRIVDLHPIGGNVLLVSGYKSGKTTLTLNLLRSLVDETPFLGRFEVEPFAGNVCIVNYEETPSQWRRHVRKLGIKNPERVFAIHRRGKGIMPLWVDGYRKKVVEMMKRSEIAYWIMDPAAVAWLGLVENENDNSLVGRFAESLDLVKEQAGIGELLLTHHEGRSESGRGRGATRLEDWMDAGWYLEKDGLIGTRALYAKGRDVEVEKFDLEWDEQRHMLLAGDSQSDHDKQDQVRKNKEFKRVVLEILDEVGPKGINKSKLFDEANNRMSEDKLHRVTALRKLTEYDKSPITPVSMRKVGNSQMFFSKRYFEIDSETTGTDGTDGIDSFGSTA